MKIEEWNMWWKKCGKRDLNKFLVEDWDPIGVSDDPAAANEYDDYAMSVAGLLRRNASAKDIASYLATVEQTRMGFSTSGSCLLPVGERIVEWYSNSIKEWQVSG